MAAVGLYYVAQPGGYPFTPFNLVNFVSGQLGHLLFAMFGDLASLIGGPALQVAFPLGLFFYLFLAKKHLLAALALFWTAQSLFDVAVYARDARALQIPVLGGDHVWNALLYRLGLLAFDQFVSALFYLSAVLVLTAAITLGLYAARRTR